MDKHTATQDIKARLEVARGLVRHSPNKALWLVQAIDARTARYADADIITPDQAFRFFDELAAIRDRAEGTTGDAHG